MELADTYRAFRDEVQRLQALFLGQERPNAAEGFWRAPDPWAIQATCVIRLHDEWARYCRAVVLASASGKASTLRGVAIPRSPLVARGQSALAALRSTNARWLRINIWEPKWHEPSRAIDAAARLRISNYADFSAGLGATSVAPEELRVVRNYLAHRHRTTADELVNVKRRVGIPRSARPEEIPRWIRSNGSVLVSEWSEELLRLARQAAS